MKKVSAVNGSGQPVSPPVYVADEFDLAVTAKDVVGPKVILIPKGVGDVTVQTVAVEPIVIHTKSLPNGKVGVLYSAQVVITGGEPGVVIHVDGVPPGLSYADGWIKGVPERAATATVVVTVEDAAGQAAEQTYQFSIAAASPPPPAARPSLPPVPVGYRVVADYTPQMLGERLHRRTGTFGENESYNAAENVFYDAAMGCLRLVTRCKATSGKLYTGAYADLGSAAANAAERAPLECRIQVLARFPYWFGAWADALWMCYGPKGQAASANRFEIDLAEWFPGQTPGYNNNQVHSPDTAKSVSSDGKNLIRGRGDGSQGTTIFGQAQGPVPLPKGTAPGTLRRGVQSFAWGVAGDGQFSIPGHTGVVLAEVEVRKAPNGSSWKPRIDFSFGGFKCVSWLDPYTPANQPPAWYVPGDDAHAWDMRLDSWVGGGPIPRATSGGQRNFRYDARAQDGTTRSYFAPAGTAPNADLWIADPSAVYSLDIFALRVLAPTA